MSQYDDEEPEVNYAPSSSKRGNNLPFWGNIESMNMNPLILTNIMNSPYYKTTLIPIKTFHEIVDQIYYKVEHLEPWEKGSRSTANQTGMCGGVRGVGAGGIVSSCFCILYKLSSLRLTRKQVTALINHCDSPYIRGVGFMYIRYTQPPEDLLDWYDPYIEDPEEIDVKAGTGKSMTIGDMVKSFLMRLEWFDTRFPRIPVNVQKQINLYMDDRMKAIRNENNYRDEYREPVHERKRSPSRERKHKKRSSSRERLRSGSRERKRSGSTERHHSSSREKKRSSPSKDRRRSSSRERKHSHKKKRKEHKRSKSRSRERRRSRSRSRERYDKTRDFQDELKAYKEHKKSKKRARSRSRSRDNHR